MNLKDLAKPFPEDQIHWRLGSVKKDGTQGMVLAYLDARNVMERLDEVCGPENWQVRHPRTGYCEIGINIHAGLSYMEGQDSAKDTQFQFIAPEWVWKGDGADQTKVEGTKGQFSDCEKRAAVQWGIGRYLYELPNQWVDVIANGNSHKIKNPKALRLPDWAVPQAPVILGEVLGEPMDAGKLTKAVAYIKKVIDADITEEERTETLIKVSEKLNNDESLWVAGQLHDKAPGSKKKYKNIYSEYLNPKPTEGEE